jgi:hypothetical protein
LSKQASKDYVRTVRPPQQPAFLTLHFAPGESAQVDWGSAGFLPVGSTRRRLSFSVMVLCHMVEKSVDLKSWSPVLMQNASNPTKAFYRLRIQRQRLVRPWPIEIEA